MADAPHHGKEVIETAYASRPTPLSLHRSNCGVDKQVSDFNMSVPPSPSHESEPRETLDVLDFFLGKVVQRRENFVFIVLHSDALPSFWGLLSAFRHTSSAGPGTGLLPTVYFVYMGSIQSLRLQAIPRLQIQDTTTMPRYYGTKYKAKSTLRVTLRYSFVG